MTDDLTLDNFEAMMVRAEQRLKVSVTFACMMAFAFELTAPRGVQGIKVRHLSWEEVDR